MQGWDRDISVEARRMDGILLRMDGTRAMLKTIGNLSDLLFQALSCAFTDQVWMEMGVVEDERIVGQSRRGIRKKTSYYAVQAHFEGAQ